MIWNSTKAGAMTFCCLALLFLLFGPCSSGFAQSQPQGSSVSAPGNIVLLYSYGEGLPAYQQATRAFLSAMEEGVKEGVVSEKGLFFEYLDLERQKDEEHYRKLTALFLHKYATRKIDLIVTVHGPALRYILNEGRDLCPGTPVLSYLGPTTIETAGVDRRFVLLPMSMDFRGTLQLAQRLFPRTRRVVFVNGIGEGEQRLEREAKSIFSRWPDTLEFEYTSDMSVEEMLQRIAALSHGTVVIYSNVFTDKTGRGFVNREVAERVAKAANVPVFGMYNTLLGKGIIGGSVFNFEAEGSRAGMLALDILRGKLPLSEPATILSTSRTPMFDWQQLKRWGVDESALPIGSIVLNKHVSVWDQYKFIILGVLIFILLESILLTVLFLERRRKNIAEQSLRESEERLDFATASAGAGIWIMHMETGSVWVTDKLRELFGFAPDEELKFERFLEVIHPDDREIVRENVRQSLEKQEPLSVEYRILHPDGSLRWIVSRGHPSSEAPGKPKRLMGVSSDVTRRKKAELQLSESRTLLSALVDSTSDMIWSVDSERFGLLTFNRALYEYFLNQRGIRIEVGMDPGVLLPTEEYAETWRTFYRRALEEGSFTTEYPVYTGTRTLLLNLNRLEQDGIAFGVSVFGKDITERKQSEEALRESEEKYRSLYESMMDGYVLVDMDGRILKFNESYREMTGYAGGELPGLTYRDITPEKWHAAEQEIIEKQVLVRGYSDVYEKEYRAKDGTVFPIELRTFLLKNDTGGSLGMWAIVRDISGRKQIESEARKLREDLAHVTRVSTLGELTSSLAHEINQPLAAILSNAQAAQRFLSQDQPDMKEIGEILGDIIRDDNRAAEVIRKIRSLLKKEETRYESLILNDVVEEILNVIRNDTAIAALSIEKEFDAGLPAVWGDRIQLQQVILNLVLNAAESMRDAGPGPRRLTVVTSKKDDLFAEVSVRDTGPGIDGNIAARLFEPFYTTKSGGIGMGLAISREIIKSHGGEIRALNNPDRGAAVTFTVPFDNGVKP